MKSEVTLSAYLLRCGPRTFLGVQSTLEGLGKEQGFVVLPVHFMWLCERTGDTVTLRAPKKTIAWVPFLRPVDPPAKDAPDVPSLENLTGEGIAFMPDIDRLLRIYAKHAGDASFWEEPHTFRRVRE